MAYVLLDKRYLDLKVVCGALETFEPSTRMKEICKRLAQCQDEVKEIESLIEKENEVICPNWLEFKKEQKQKQKQGG